MQHAQTANQIISSMQFVIISKKIEVPLKYDGDAQIDDKTNKKVEDHLQKIHFIFTSFL
jgi:hypothetical protein